VTPTETAKQSILRDLSLGRSIHQIMKDTMDKLLHGESDNLWRDFLLAKVEALAGMEA